MPSGSVFELANLSATANEGFGFQVISSNGQHWNKSRSDHLYLTNFDMMGAPYGRYAGMVRFDDMMTASECALWMCINTYDTLIRSGKQTQNITSSFHYIPYSPYNLTKNYTFNYPDRGSASEDPGSFTDYTIFGFAFEALTEQFSSGGSDDSSIIDGTVRLYTNSHVPSGSVTNAIWAGTGYQDKWIQNLATSMSNVVRTTSPSPRNIYAGTAYLQGIHVQWWWMTLPVATIAASVLLLVVVMIRTARSNVQAWRGSPLTLLLFEVDDDIKRAVKDTAETIGKELDFGVRRRKVTLGKTDDGTWIFKSYQSPITSEEKLLS